MNAEEVGKKLTKLDLYYYEWRIIIQKKQNMTIQILHFKFNKTLEFNKTLNLSNGNNIK